MNGNFQQSARNSEMTRLRREALDFSSRCALNVRLKTGEITPADGCVVLTLEEYGPEAAPMVWGLEPSAGGPLVTHVPAESALDDAGYHQSLHFRPLAVPATGLVGWPALLRPDGRRMYRKVTERPFFLAGFYEPLTECGGEWRETFAILTAETHLALHGPVEPLPLLLSRYELDDWLGGSHLEDFLTLPPIRGAATPVNA